jgi:hypothetical protein
MRLAQEDYFNTLRGLHEASLDPMLQDTSLSPSASLTPRAMRRGVGVAVFGLFEAFVESCLEECLVSVASGPVQFGYLPDKLQSFLSIDAISGLANRVRLTDRSYKRQLVDDYIPKVASYAGAAPVYTSLGLIPSGSNVQVDKIKEALSSFGLQNSWALLSQWSSDIQGSVLDIEGALRQLSSLRNKSAHDASFVVPATDLTSNIEKAATIGIVIAVAFREIAEAFRASVRNQPPSLSSIQPSWRFIDNQGERGWLERTMTGRARKYYATEQEARAGASGRPRPAHIVVRDERTFPLALV